MSAKILKFDPNRRVPPLHYTPIAMRGRLLCMPRTAVATSDLAFTVTSCRCAAESSQGERSQPAQEPIISISAGCAPWWPSLKS